MQYPYPVGTNTSKALVVFSGGQDSTTCLLWAIDNFDEVHAVTFNYGQKHAVEIIAAETIIQLLGDRIASWETVTLGPILKSTSPLVNPEEHLEQYADAESLPGGLEKTFVPMRNQLFLTLAANRAYVLGCRNLVTGICQADSGGYPDCREDFANSLQLTTNLGTFTGEPGTVGNIKVHTPLMHLSKAESIELAIDVGAYGMLMWTHTAYDGVYPPIGNDHANLLREAGFTEAGIADPLIVRAWFDKLMPLPEERPGYSEVALTSDLPPSADYSDLYELLERSADDHVVNTRDS